MLEKGSVAKLIVHSYRSNLLVLLVCTALSVLSEERGTLIVWHLH